MCIKMRGAPNEKRHRVQACVIGTGGFTLLEMSIVVAVIATVVAGTISMGSSAVEQARRVNTNNKLDTIEASLMSYRLATNRIPCPTDPTITDIPANSATYGYETGTAGNVRRGSTTSYTVPLPNVGTVVEGALPVKTLGLPDEFQLDGWGRKFAYAAWTPLTATATLHRDSLRLCINYGISPSCGAVKVENAAHANRTATGVYALLSYGPDGHGGYLKSGRRYNAGISNVDEIANSHYSSGGADTGLYAGIYIQKEFSTYAGDGDAAHPFSHIVRYKERWQMQNAYDTYNTTGSPCALGFRIDGPAANAYTSSNFNSMALGDVNGDNIPDLVIGAYGAFAGYVVFGTKIGFPDPLPLSSLDGTNGSKLFAQYPGVMGWTRLRQWLSAMSAAITTVWLTSSSARPINTDIRLCITATAHHGRQLTRLIPTEAQQGISTE